MDSEMLSVTEFVKKEIELLKKFEEFWLKEQKTLPKLFPEKLAVGEWCEQVSFFHDTKGV